MSLEKERLGRLIRDSLDRLRVEEGFTVDDLANYLEINSLTLRNLLNTCNWSDMCVTILKLKHAIQADLAYEYKRECEREKIRKRKDETIKNQSSKVRRIS
jgi:hypothetical protein